MRVAIREASPERVGSPAPAQVRVAPQPARSFEVVLRDASPVATPTKAAGSCDDRAVSERAESHETCNGDVDHASRSSMQKGGEPFPFVSKRSHKTFHAQKASVTKSIDGQTPDMIRCGHVTEQDAQLSQSLVAPVCFAATDGSAQLAGVAHPEASMATCESDFLLTGDVATQAATEMPKTEAVLDKLCLKDDGAEAVSQGTSTGDVTTTVVGSHDLVQAATFPATRGMLLQVNTVVAGTSPTSHTLSSTPRTATALPNTASAHHGQADWSVQTYEAPSKDKLEIGIAGGSWGWLKVRAQLSSTGDVHAVLRGSTGAAEASLRAQTSDLQSFLSQQQVSVSSVRIDSATSASWNSASSNESSAGSQGDRQQSRDERRQLQQAEASPLLQPFKLQGDGVPAALLTAGAGTWLNVMA